jgi:hypothetical protein
MKEALPGCVRKWHALIAPTVTSAPGAPARPMVLPNGSRASTQDFIASGTVRRRAADGNAFDPQSGGLKRSSSRHTGGPAIKLRPIAGYLAMGRAIDLGLFQTGCARRSQRRAVDLPFTPRLDAGHRSREVANFVPQFQGRYWSTRAGPVTATRPDQRPRL